MNRWLNFIYPMLREKEGEGAGGGVGEGGGEGAKEPTLKDVLAEINAIKTENAALKAKLEGGKKEDESLGDKVRKDQEDKDSKHRDSRTLERAVQFTYGSKEFLKQNESILPKEIGAIFEAADKEKYDTAVQKSNAIKSEVVRSFFKLQANVDFLTASQKSQLDEFLKLTQSGREEKADAVYENLFEPTIEQVKRIKKAEQLSKANSGLATEGDSDLVYKNKLIALGKRRFLGEKNA